MALYLLRPLLRAPRFAPRVLRPRFRPIHTSLSLNETLKRYTPDHEWVAFDTESSTATIGITEYAANSLGDVVYVELPSVADAVAKAEPFGAVESVKSASDIMSPVDGEIVEVNEALNEKPGGINKDPEGAGWLVKVKVKGGEASLEGLMEEAEYKAFTEE